MVDAKLIWRGAIMDRHHLAELPISIRLRRWITTPPVYWIALLGLCAAYLQGGFNKAIDFNSAIAEMNHFGLAPAAPFAIAVIILELGASAMILTGFYRWLGALGLA